MQASPAPSASPTYAYCRAVKAVKLGQVSATADVVGGVVPTLVCTPQLDEGCVLFLLEYISLITSHPNL